MNTSQSPATYRGGSMGYEAPGTEIVTNPVTGRKERVYTEEYMNSKEYLRNNRTMTYNNPVTGQTETVYNEDAINRLDSMKASGDGSGSGGGYGNSSGSDTQSKGGFSDNGLPPSQANKFTQNYSARTSEGWREYNFKDDEFPNGYDVKFDPTRSELIKNPVTGKWEPVLREPDYQGGQSNSSKSSRSGSFITNDTNRGTTPSGNGIRNTHYENNGHSGSYDNGHHGH